MALANLGRCQICLELAVGRIGRFQPLLERDSARSLQARQLFCQGLEASLDAARGDAFGSQHTRGGSSCISIVADNPNVLPRKIVCTDRIHRKHAIKLFPLLLQRCSVEEGTWGGGTQTLQRQVVGAWDTV